jgi:tRNA (cmo5U34)-methyltransferase
VAKSTVEEIRQRFDNDVERFSNFETGQTAAIDSRLGMDLIAQAARRCTPQIRDILDVGCGAGNYTLRLLQEAPGANCTLVDLSQPMLDKAVERVTAAGAGRVAAVQSDLRELRLGERQFDVILAAAVLHHLRTDAEWDATFRAFHHALRPGGSFWIFDLVTGSIPGVDSLMRDRYGEYLVGLKGEQYRDTVFAYVEKEDTPRPLVEQLERLKSAGFQQVDVLHKNGPFAAFGGVA